MSTKRIGITGMAINSPLGDTLDDFLTALLEGRSAITTWSAFESDGIYSKVGGDLSGYDIPSKVAALEPSLPPEMHKRLRRLSTRVAWSTRLSMLVAADAWSMSQLSDEPVDPFQVGVIVGGHNLNSLFVHNNQDEFEEEPDYIDPMFALHSLDSDHAGCVSEVLHARGPIFTTGAACASGNAAMRCALDEIRYHDVTAVVIVGGVLEFAPIDVHAMALMGAISFESFNDRPQQASRPFDVRREGFVPAHGSAAIVVEDLDHAKRRGAHIFAEVLGVEACSDGNHLPQPAEDGQIYAMKRVLERCGLAPEQIDFVSAHATSTPLGDLTEIRAIKSVFGDHARKLKINAPKSMLGHTCWAAPTVETVAAVLQMNAGRLHPSINIEKSDPEIDLDICSNGPVSHHVEYLMKNAFGFGGINCVGLFKAHNQ